MKGSRAGGRGGGLPALRLDKAFKVGRDTTAFVKLRCGLARGAGAPEERPGGSKALLAAKERRIEEQTEELRRERRRNYRQEATLRERSLEIFRLREQLAAIDGDAGRRASAEQETGALPHFIVIGAPRCGTSQFYRVLTRHPNVDGAAQKELHFFDAPRRFDRGVDWYRGCFPAPKPVGGRESVTGEATPRYLADPLVPGRVRQVVPEARFIALLRNPVDRALSHFHLLARRGRSRSFEELVAAELEWLAGHHPDDVPGPRTNLITTGLYADHLRRWGRFFGEEQLLVLGSDDFFRRTTETVDLAQSFLGLPHVKLNPNFLGSRRGDKYEYEPMRRDTRERLEAFFEPHNRDLYELLGRDLGW